MNFFLIFFSIVTILMWSVESISARSSVQKLSLAYTSLNNCEWEQFLHSKRNPHLYRWECFKKDSVYYYEICESPENCWIDAIPEVNTLNNPYAIFLPKDIRQKFSPYILSLKNASLDSLKQIETNLDWLKPQYNSKDIWTTVLNFLLHEVRKQIKIHTLLKKEAL